MTAPARAIDGGTCHVFHAFEAAFSIDLDAAARRIAGAGRAGLTAGDRNVSGVDFAPRPLRAVMDVPGVTCGRFTTATRAHVTVFDFGAVSVRLDFPLSGPADGLAELARTLVGNAALRDAARRAAADVLQAIGDAAERPVLSERGEDYVVFALPALGRDPRTGLADTLLARTLRSEEGALSAEEVRDAVSSTVSYGEDDVAVIDWNCAVVVDRTPDDALAVLEFANVELIEMRWLDDRLDEALDEAFRTAGGSFRGARILSVQTGRHARRIAELQIDAAALFESVNNALKLFGDQWLARLHQAATHRMHIDDFERSVLRKVEALDSIYGKLRDRQVQVRAELLEWIIIGLIAVEIVLFLRD